MPSPTLTLAQALLRRESVTPTDHGCQNLLSERLTRLGFACEAMPFHGVHNLWATRGRARPLLVFAGHTDVVPPGPVAQWRFPPFAATVRDGVLYGRGAADMKGSLAAFITACERFYARHQQPRGTLGVLITSDEEGAARWGTRAVMKVLRRRGVKVDQCLVGEPSSTGAVGDVIKVGRRGSLSAILHIRGKQGHIAYPQLADNPLHRAAAALRELVALEWDDGGADFPATALQLSDVHGGCGAGNVIPGEVEVAFNVRYSPRTTAAAVRHRVRRVVSDHCPDFDLHWRLGGLPFASAPGEFVDSVAAAIHAVTGRTTARSTAGGTSDGRFIAGPGTEVVELGPCNATIHQIDECVEVAALEELSRIYEEILERTLGGQED